MAILTGTIPYVFVRKINEKEFLLQTWSDPCCKADEKFFTRVFEEYEACCKLRILYALHPTSYWYISRKSRIWKSLSFCFVSANVASRYGKQRLYKYKNVILCVYPWFKLTSQLHLEETEHWVLQQDTSIPVRKYKMLQCDDMAWPQSAEKRYAFLKSALDVAALSIWRKPLAQVG